MTKNSSFELKEQKGRDLFTKFAENNKEIKIVAFADDKFANWDVAYTYGTSGVKRHQVCGEIKLRNNPSDFYPTHMLQMDKLLALQAKVTKRKGLKIHYINHFSDNMTYIWDITDLVIQPNDIEAKYCNRNDWTYDDKILKPVTFLRPSDCIFRGTTDGTDLFDLPLNKEEQDNEEYNNLGF